MANILITTEKPSVARQFASALKVQEKEKHKGYIEGYSEYFGCAIWISWAVGHLIELSYPEAYDPDLKRWSLDTIPFLPKTYKYQVKKETKEQFEILKKLLNQVGGSAEDKRELAHIRSSSSLLFPPQPGGVIFNAGDSGREGEYIQRLIYTAAGVEGKKQIRRVWIDSQTDAEIKRGIREAKKEASYDHLSSAAYERAIEDYAVGINLSRALSCKFGYQFNREIEQNKKKDKYIPIAVGRVMTCVLAMIVDRENEIRKFVPTNFYKIDADHGSFRSHWKPVEGTKYFGSDKLNENGFVKEEDAKTLLSNLQTDDALQVLSATSKDVQKAAPLLYNLAELQSDCSKLFKISPDETLQIAQSLYEKKLTTYPRTDARVLSTPVAIEIQKNIQGAGKVSGLTEFSGTILRNAWQRGIEKTRYTDDKKITDHHAIIPTGEGNLEDTEGLERTVYLLICKRFFSIFYPPAVYKQQNAELLHRNGEHFFASSKALSSRGYLEVLGISEEDKDEGKALDLSAGLRIHAKFLLQEGTTQPPKRYTSGSMILAMENAGKLIEEAELREQIKGSGIGTSATRAEVIKKLTGNQYVNLQKKTQILTPTPIGEAVYKYVKLTVPSMLSPRMTASWEKGLSEIESGDLPAEKYRATMEKFVSESTALIKTKEAAGYSSVEKKISGKCPACGSDLYESEKMYWCSGYKKDDEKSCQFRFPKTICQVPLSKEDIESLLSGKPTSYHRDFIGKNGKPFEARLEMEENGAIKLGMKPRETAGRCPVCGKDLYFSKGIYWCSGHDKDDPNSCQFSFGTTICGVNIGEANVNHLLSGEPTDVIHGMRSKTGKTFDASLVIGLHGKVEIKFPTTPCNMICPSCGKKLMADAYTYTCDCGFFMPKMMAKRKFTQAEMDTLYHEGELKNVSGFHKKDGSGTFTADLTFSLVDGCKFHFKNTGAGKRKGGKRPATKAKRKKK